MRHGLKVAVAAATIAALSAGPAVAQSDVRVGFGLTGLFPLEGAGATSWGGMGLVTYGPPHGLAFRADGSLVRGGDRTKLLATGNAVYVFHSPLSVFHPYLLGGGGLFLTSDDTEPMIKLGGGLEYHLVERNRGPVLFGEPTVNFIFQPDERGGTATALQVNLGVKLGG